MYRNKKTAEQIWISILTVAFELRFCFKPVVTLKSTRARDQITRDMTALLTTWPSNLPQIKETIYKGCNERSHDVLLQIREHKPIWARNVICTPLRMRFVLWFFQWLFPSVPYLARGPFLQSPDNFSGLEIKYPDRNIKNKSACPG